MLQGSSKVISFPLNSRALSRGAAAHRPGMTASPNEVDMVRERFSTVGRRRLRAGIELS
jgi:hypothetical protein